MFDAHDAMEDAAALSQVLFQSPLKVKPEKFIEKSSQAAAFILSWGPGWRPGVKIWLPLSKSWSHWRPYWPQLQALR